MLKLFPCAKWL